jgi:hypothetical protein
MKSDPAAKKVIKAAQDTPIGKTITVRFWLFQEAKDQVAKQTIAQIHLIPKKGRHTVHHLRYVYYSPIRTYLRTTTRFEPPARK